MLKILVIIQIYLLISVAAEGKYKCPPPSDIYPCTCVSAFIVQLECNTPAIDEIYKTLDYISANRLAFPKILLTSSTTEKLRPDLLGNATAEHLYLDFVNARDSLNPFVFRGQENSLQTIEFQNFKLSHVPVNALKDLSFKGLFYLNDRSLTKLEKGCFQALNRADETTVLFLNHNGIDTIEDAVFDRFTSLELLTLDDNRLTVVNANSFQNVVKGLNSLHLSRNKFTSLPSNIIGLMSEHAWISLQDNQIKEITKQTFDDIFDLKLNVDLRGNPIDCGCSFLTFIYKYNGSGAYMFSQRTFCVTPRLLQGLKLSELTETHLNHCLVKF